MPEKGFVIGDETAALINYMACDSINIETVL